MMNHLILGQALAGTKVHGWGDSAKASRLSLIARLLRPARATIGGTRRGDSR